MVIPLVLMELAFNDLDEIKTTLVDELLYYKGKHIKTVYFITFKF